jgi:hypothetical protein
VGHFCRYKDSTIEHERPEECAEAKIQNVKPALRQESADHFYWIMVLSIFDGSFFGTTGTKALLVRVMLLHILGGDIWKG